MKFTVKKRVAEIGVLNLRTEKNGPQKVPACDLPLRWKVSKANGNAEINMIFPSNGIQLSEFLFDKDGKLQTHVASPLAVHRKPENIRLKIFDYELDPKKFLTFENVTFKSIKLEIEPDGDAYCSVTAQFHASDKDYERLVRIMDQTRKIECRLLQPELPLGEGGNEDDEEEDQADVED